MRVEVKGLDKLLDKFDRIAKESPVMVQKALNDWADRTATDAIDLAPANESNLRQSIKPKYGDGFAEVTAKIRYAAYVEFGTRKFAQSYVSTLPPDWQAYAATFKGPASNGGNLRDMWLSFKEWGRKKGLSPTHTYFAFKKVLRDGSRPHPFLYPAVIKNIPQLIKDLKDIIK